MSGQIDGDLKAILEVGLPDVSAGGIKTLLYLCERDAVTVSRISKDLSLGESMVRRALSELGEDAGEGFLRVDDSGLVRLSDLGRRIRGG
jgi:hypothetical protein